jgi:uncharacterized protein YecA (UPF0149 family)
MSPVKLPEQPRYHTRPQHRGLKPRLDLFQSLYRQIAGPQPAPTPARSTRVPRNAPCPCGSGRKFKKCCNTAAKEVS